MTGRVVLVVGAGSGIGLATATAFAARGETLVLVSRSTEALEAAEAVCRAAGAGPVDVVAEDIGEPAAAGRIVARVLDRYGRIDVVVHTATVMAYGTVETMPADVFTAVVATSVHGTLHLARAVLPVLRRQHAGTFVGVNSLLGSVTVPQMGAYVAAKWGQRALLRTLQQETRDEPGVHVCIVSPGAVRSGAQNEFGELLPLRPSTGQPAARLRGHWLNLDSYDKLAPYSHRYRLHATLCEVCLTRLSA